MRLPRGAARTAAAYLLAGVLCAALGIDQMIVQNVPPVTAADSTLLGSAYDFPTSNGQLKPVSVRYVRVYRTTMETDGLWYYLQVAEMQVLGSWTTNATAAVDFAQSSTPSSSSYLPTQTPVINGVTYTYRDSTAVLDGTYTQVFHSASSDYLPWLELDLGSEKMVSAVHLVNRVDPDNCQHRLTNVAMAWLGSDRSVKAAFSPLYTGIHTYTYVTTTTTAAACGPEPVPRNTVLPTAPTLDGLWRITSWVWHVNMVLRPVLARYIRLYKYSGAYTQSKSLGNWIIVREVDVWTGWSGTAPTGPSVALGKSVSASGYNVSDVPGNLVDGQTFSHWASGNVGDQPNWAIIDLGRDYNISVIRVTPHPSYDKWMAGMQYELITQSGVTAATYRSDTPAVNPIFLVAGDPVGCDGFQPLAALDGPALTAGGFSPRFINSSLQVTQVATLPMTGWVFVGPLATTYNGLTGYVAGGAGCAFIARDDAYLYIQPSTGIVCASSACGYQRPLLTWIPNPQWGAIKVAMVQLTVNATGTMFGTCGDGITVQVYADFALVTSKVLTTPPGGLQTHDLTVGGGPVARLDIAFDSVSSCNCDGIRVKAMVMGRPWFGLPSPTPSPSVSPSLSPSMSATVSTSASVTGTASPSLTRSPSMTVSRSVTASASPSLSATISGTVSGSKSPSLSASVSTTKSVSATVTVTASPTVSATTSPSATASLTATASSTVTASVTASMTASVSTSASFSATVSPSSTTSASASVSATISSTVSTSVSPSSSISPSMTTTASSSPSQSSIVNQAALLVSGLAGGGAVVAATATASPVAGVQPVLVDDGGTLPPAGVVVEVAPVLTTAFINRACDAAASRNTDTGIVLHEGDEARFATITASLRVVTARDAATGSNVSVTADSPWLMRAYAPSAAGLTCSFSPPGWCSISPARWVGASAAPGGGVLLSFELNVTSATWGTNASAWDDYVALAQAQCTAPVPVFLRGRQLPEPEAVPPLASLLPSSRQRLSTSTFPVLLHRNAAPMILNTITITPAATAASVFTAAACNVSVVLLDAVGSMAADSCCNVPTAAVLRQVAAQGVSASLAAGAVSLETGVVVTLWSASSFPRAAAAQGGVALRLTLGHVQVSYKLWDGGEALTFVAPPYEQICNVTAADARASLPPCPQPVLRLQVDTPAASVARGMTMPCEAVSLSGYRSLASDKPLSSSGFRSLAQAGLRDDGVSLAERQLDLVFPTRAGGAFSCPPYCGVAQVVAGSSDSIPAPTPAPAASGIVYTRPCPVPPASSRASFAECANTSLTVKSGHCFYGEEPFCQLCPANAACPGGFRMWSLPGGYLQTEDTATPPTPCDPPATERCVGWDAATGTTLCGVGYLQGSVQCAVCAPGYYADDLRQSACSACPTDDATALARGVGTIVGVVCGLTLAMAAVVVAALLTNGGTFKGGLKRLVSFATTVFSTLQLVAQVTRAAPPQATPAAVAAIFAAVGFLQFEGVNPLPVSCTNVSPLAAPCIIMAVGIICHTVWQVSVGCWMCASPSMPPLQRCLTAVLYPLGHLAAVVAGLGYGIVTNAVFDVLLCSAPKTITYAQYAGLRNDGSAAARAGIDPSSPSSMLLQVEVAFLRSNRSIVCYEGSHTTAYWLAVATLVIFCVGYPLLTWVTITRAVVPRLLRQTRVPAELLRRGLCHVSFGGVALATTLVELAGLEQGKAVARHQMLVAAQKATGRRMSLALPAAARRSPVSVQLSGATERELLQAATPSAQCCARPVAAPANESARVAAALAPKLADAKLLTRQKSALSSTIHGAAAVAVVEHAIPAAKASRPSVLVSAAAPPAKQSPRRSSSAAVVAASTALGRVMLADGTSLFSRPAVVAPKGAWVWERVTGVFVPLLGCNCCCRREIHVHRMHAADVMDSALALNPAAVRAALPAWRGIGYCLPATPLVDSQYRVSQGFFTHADWLLLLVTTSCGTVLDPDSSSDAALIARGVVLCLVYVVAAAAIVAAQPFRPHRLWFQPVQLLVLLLSALSALHNALGSTNTSPDQTAAAASLAYVVAALCVVLLPVIMITFALTMFAGSRAEARTAELLATTTAAATTAELKLLEAQAGGAPPLASAAERRASRIDRAAVVIAAASSSSSGNASDSLMTTNPLLPHQRRLSTFNARRPKAATGDAGVSPTPAPSSSRVVVASGRLSMGPAQAASLRGAVAFGQSDEGRRAFAASTPFLRKNASSYRR